MPAALHRGRSREARQKQHHATAINAMTIHDAFIDQASMSCHAAGTAAIPEQQEGQEADQRHQPGQEHDLGIGVGPVDPAADRLLDERVAVQVRKLKHARDISHPPRRQLLA